MAITAADWTVDRDTGDVRYIGDDHGDSPTYAPVIDFHRWLQGLADDAVASGDDELDITNTDPSARSTDNIIALKPPYNIDKRSSEFLYDGSIIQDDGDTIYDGIVNFGPATVIIQVLQDGKVIADDFWNEGSSGFNADSNSGISHRFMILVRADGADIDGRKLLGVARTFGNTFEEFPINSTSRGNNVLALSDSDDLNNETVITTVAGWTSITNTEGLRGIDVDNDSTDEEYYSEWNTDQPTRDINEFYERTKWLSKDPVAEDSSTDTGSDFKIDDATITGAAQSFTVGVNAVFATKVVVWLKGTASPNAPTGDITASIFTHNGTYGTSSVPNAITGVVSNTYDAALLTTTYEPVTFEFNIPVALTASTYYCLVLEHADGTATDYVSVQGLASSGTHDGNRSHDTAGWTAVAADDIDFELYTAPSLNGLPGIEFRGITHSFGYDTETGGISISTNDQLAWGTALVYSGPSGTAQIGEVLVEDTAIPQWTARILAIDVTNTTLIVDVDNGVVETTDTFTGATSGFQATVNGTPTVVSGGGLLHILADDTTDDILYAQVLRGAMAADDAPLYYCGTDPATTDTTDYVQVHNAGATITERSISTPFVGASTGSSIIGSYGLGIEALDLSNADKVFDLTNTQRTPPNNVTNTVGGLESGEDYVIVAPWDGTSYDSNDDPAFDKDQLSLDVALTTDDITEVEVTESIPSDTPASGYIRVTDDLGFERRLHYGNWENGTPNRFYNIDTTDGNEDFSGDEATDGNDVYITYLDILATSGTESYTAVHTAGTRTLVVVVRDGDTTPIKQFISQWTFVSSGQTLTAIRTTDA